MLFVSLGLPTVEPQVVIRDERGSLVGRVDFLFRAQRTIVEFDGLVKYGVADWSGAPGSAVSRFVASIPPARLATVKQTG